MLTTTIFWTSANDKFPEDYGEYLVVIERHTGLALEFAGWNKKIFFLDKDFSIHEKVKFWAKVPTF